MSNAHFFLVNYILKNQPRSTKVRSGTRTLSNDQARIYVEALHAVNSSDQITDIEVHSLDQHRSQRTADARH